MTGRKQRELSEEEVTALGEDLHRHQELDDAIGLLIKENLLDAKRCSICMGPCPLFTEGAKPCNLVPPKFAERNAELHELLTEIIELRESKGLPGHAL